MPRKSSQQSIGVPSQQALEALDKATFRNDGIPSIAPLVVQALENNQGDSGKNYRIFEIPKGPGKTRTIEAPSEALKFVQRRIQDLLRKATLSEASFGFRAGQSAYTGLRSMIDTFEERDQNVDACFETDITDFFPSVNRDQVQEEVYHFLYRILHNWNKGPKLTTELVQELAELITELCCLEERLPQGAPSSPTLSNMVASSSFDRIIQKKAKEAGIDGNLTYGRYADDIMILGSEHIPEEFRHLVISILKSFGFQAAPHKTHYKENDKKYRIWGVDLLPADKKSDKKLRFRIPHSRAKTWASQMHALIDHNNLRGDALPTTQAEFLEHKEVASILGKFAHAHHIARIGGDTIKDDLYVLPDRMAHAWRQFLEKFGDILPASASGWFSNQAMKMQEQVDYVDADKEVFTQKRQATLCEKRNITPEELTAKIDEAKSSLLEMEETINKDETLVEFELSDQIANIAESIEDNDDLSEEEIRALFETSLYQLIAFVELTVFNKEDVIENEDESDAQGESLLTLKLNREAWERLCEAIKGQAEERGDTSLYAILRGTRYLFWDAEKEVTKVLAPVPKKQKHTKDKKSNFINLPGFKEKK